MQPNENREAPQKQQIFFKYNFFGTKTPITADIFLEHLPSLDARIASAFFILILLYMFLFYGTIFNGLFKIQIILLVISLLTFIIALLFQSAQRNKQLKRLKVFFYLYYTIRYIFVAIGTMATLGLFMIVLFLQNYESLISLRQDDKDKIQEQLDSLVISINLVVIISFLYSAVQLYFCIHQIFWQNLLDISQATVLELLKSSGDGENESEANSLRNKEDASDYQMKQGREKEESPTVNKEPKDKKEEKNDSQV